MKMQMTFQLIFSRIYKIELAASNIWKMKYLIIIAFLQTTFAEYHSDSPCPVRPIQQNFDIKKVILKFFGIVFKV